MLYVSFAGEAASLKLWDFATGTETMWASGLQISREHFHNFCWLHYNPETNKAQVAWQAESEKSRYLTVAHNGAGGEGVEFDVNNACIFSFHKHSLYVANNFGDPKTLAVYGLHPDGQVHKSTMNFDKEDSSYTVQEFCWLRDNTFLMVAIEGQCGKSLIHKGADRGHTLYGLTVDGVGGKLTHDHTYGETNG